MMRKMKVLAAFVVVLLGATIASAQATRTWVSGVGDDANPCSRTAPCKTFAGAISKTAPGGEIDALDPGGFGALTITKSITLDGGGGQVASVLVAGTNGIVVAAQPTDNVVIRNMRLDGLRGGGNANAGLSGIRFISGNSLEIENTTIFGFNNTGIDVELGASGYVHILNTVVNNIGACAPGVCLTAQGDGMFFSTTSGTLRVGIEHSSVITTSNNGIEAGGNSRVQIEHSTVENAGANGIVGSTGTGQATISFSNVNHNVSGITSQNGSGVNVSFSNVAYNTACGLNNASAANTMVTFGNNRLVNNTNTCGNAIQTLGQF